VPLRLEKIGRRRLPVRARVIGEPAAGMTIGEITVEPSVALLSGPRLQLAALPAVITEPVNVDGAEAAVDTLVALRSPNPLMTVIEPLTVRVTVEVVRRETHGGKRR
jgi:YbbR domain-containing protein